MGSPRKLKKKYEVPRKAWERERVTAERKLVKVFGTKRKKEIRRAETILRELKRRARALVARVNPTEEKLLIGKAHSLGLVDKKATIDDILGLTVGNVLERRLQTMLMKKELANNTRQARQFITHGHITVAGQKVKSPSYIVLAEEEDKIAFAPKSSLNKSFRFFTRKPKEKPVEKKEVKVEEKIIVAEAPREEEVKSE